MRIDDRDRMVLPYPWTASDGLARILDDPSLWNDVFADSPLRAALEQSLRRIRRTHPRSVGGEGDLGIRLCEVLRRSFLRRQVSDDLQDHVAPEYRRYIFLSMLLGTALLQHVLVDRVLCPPLPLLLDAALKAQVAAPAPDDFGRLLQALPADASPSLGPLLAAALALLHRPAAASYAEALLAHDPTVHIRIAATPAVVPAPAVHKAPVRPAPKPVHTPLSTVRVPAVSPKRPTEPDPATPDTTPLERSTPAPAPSTTEADALRAASLCTALADSDVHDASPLLTVEGLSAAIATLCEAPGSDPARAVHACLGDDLDALMAALWHLDERRAVAMCALVPPERRLAALASCSFAQIQQTADAGRELATAAAAALLVSTLQSDDPEALEYLDPCLPPLLPACAAFFQGARRAARRGELAAALRGLFAPSDDLPEPAPAGRRVRERITGVPGMAGHFHRLRVTAHRKFIAPLAPLAADDQAGAVLDRWLAEGTLADKLAACITDQPDGVRLGLEPIHVEKTRQYLQQFEDLLNDWASGAAPQTEEFAEFPLAEAWDALRRATVTSPTCEWLVRVVEVVARDVADPTLPAEIGRQWVANAGALVRLPDAGLSPLRFQSWLLRSACRPVPLAVFVADGVRKALGKAPQTLVEAVDTMVAEEDFRAARVAAEGTPLADNVRAAADRAAAGLRDKYARELAAAAAARQPGDELDESLTLVAEAFAADELDDAEALLQTLENQVDSVLRRRDPTRAPAVAFLQALGLKIANDERSETLRVKVDAQRDLHIGRRWHIIALRHAADDTALPASLRRASAVLADGLDHPLKWPIERVAHEIHDDLEVLFRYTRGQLRDAPSSEATTLELTIAGRLAALIDGARSGDRTLAAVAATIREYRSSAEILRRIDPRLASSRAALFAHARALYREEQWQLARNLLVAALPQDEDDDHVLRAGVELAHCLWNASALDVDWPAVHRHARWLRDHAATPPGARGQASRLAELSAVLERVRNNRLVDELALPGDDPDPQAAHAALLVLLLQLRQAERSRGAAEAVNVALAMPEQIFRVWARWALGLDYARVPGGEAHLWQIVAREWDPRRDVVFRPPPLSGPFPSFRCFALFVQAELLHAEPGVADRAPERSFGDLQRALGLLRMRNDGAHASFRPSEDQRRQFFALVHRWLDRLFEACPGGGGRALRDELSALLGPLMLDG